MLEEWEESGFEKGENESFSKNFPEYHWILRDHSLFFAGLWFEETCIEQTNL